MKFVMKTHYLIKKWAKAEIKKEIESILELNKNENTMYPNLWDKIIHLKALEQKGVTKSKLSRWQIINK